MLNPNKQGLTTDRNEGKNSFSGKKYNREFRKLCNKNLIKFFVINVTEML